MSEDASEAYAKIKTVDLKKAHEDGCEDVKRVLKNMYPDVFKEKWVDITDEIRWLVTDNTYGDGWWLCGKHNGEHIIHAHPDGMYIQSHFQGKYRIIDKSTGIWRYIEVQQKQ